MTKNRSIDCFKILTEFKMEKSIFQSNIFIKNSLFLVKNPFVETNKHTSIVSCDGNPTVLLHRRFRIPCLSMGLFQNHPSRVYEGDDCGVCGKNRNKGKSKE